VRFLRRWAQFSLCLVGTWGFPILAAKLVWTVPTPCRAAELAFGNYDIGTATAICAIRMYRLMHHSIGENKKRSRLPTTI